MGTGINIGIGVTASPGAIDLVQQLRDAIAQLRAELAASTGGGAAAMTADINQVIGAFQEMGATIDATNAKAVAAFRQEGDALAIYLAQLGATDAELNKIGASIDKLETKAGAAKITPLIPDLGPANTQIDRVPVGARRAANSLSTLAFAAATGNGNMKLMALSMGSAVAGLAQLTSSARLAASATGLGALITVIGTIAILMEGLENKTQGANKAVTEFGNLRVQQLEILQKAIERQFQAQQAEVNSFSRLQLATTKDGIAASNRLDDLAKKRELIADAVVAAAKKEGHDVYELQKKETEQVEQLRTARLQGEFAAKKLEADQELKTQEEEIAKLSMTDAQRTQALTTARRIRNEKIATVDKEQAEKVKDLTNKMANETLAIVTKGDNDQVLEARQAANREFDDEMIAINKLKLVGENAEEQKTALIASAAKRRSAKIDEANAEERKKLKDEVIAAQAELNTLTGNETEGRAEAIEQKYKELIKRLARINDQAGIATVRKLINVEGASAAMADVEKEVTTGADVLSGKLTEIQLRVTAHTLNERDARDETIAAYERYIEVVQKSIPVLQEQADIIGSPEAQQKVDAARLKLLELQATVAELSDEFLKLKQAARDSVQEGLSQVLDDAAANVAHLDASFRDAAQSIIASLRKVASQMLANLIIQKSLGFLGGLFGGGVNASMSGDVLNAAGTANVASGGLIRGPGTATSDSIPARLSDGEYVINAMAVRSLGVDFLDAVNAADRSPSGRRRPKGYADGGLVRGNSGGTSSLETTIGLEDGLIVKHMQTRDGQAAIVSAVGANKKTVNALLRGG